MVSPFAVGLTGMTFSVGAILATEDDLDDLADYHKQFAATSEQELRVRSG